MAEQKKKSSKFNMYVVLLLFTLIPLIVGVGTISVILVMNASSEVKSTTMSYLYDLTESEGKALADEVKIEGVEAATTYENLKEMYAGVGLDGVSSSYAYVVAGDGTMIYHPTESKVGEPVSNSVVKGLVDGIAKGKHADPAVVEYVFNGVQKYAAYYMNETNDFILVIGADESDILAKTNEILWIAIFVAIGLVVVFVILVILIGKKISSPLGAVARNIEKISEGDISSKKESASANIAETKLLISASIKLQDELSSVITQTQSIAQELIAAVEEVSDLAQNSAGETSGISNAMEDLAQGATSLAASVQDINEQVVQISTIIGDIAENVDNLSSSSETIQKANADATDYINKVASSSEKSVGAVTEINSQIMATNEAIAKIDAAVNVISSVASQTNLLALNASIEAARAGEAGRGFAVVADEINSLSVQSADGAKEIATIVAEIKTQSARSVDLAEQVNTIITEEQGYIGETQSKFDVLRGSIEESLEAITQISNKMEGLEQVRSVISSNVEDLSAISEENAASNEEVSASLSSIASSVDTISENSKNMNELSNQLKDVVSFFR
ncbi:MAG: hypothetical protein KBS85_01560 [Lachnospiraceae bacterium]|nr:hypothetical protein [Candidatus Merdinaster equi]